MTLAPRARHHTGVKIIRVIACLFSAIECSLAANPDVTFEQAKASYYQAVDGNSAAIKEASKRLQEIRDRSPEQSLVLAYWGSIRLLEASKTFAVWRKGKLSQEGLTALDEAVARAPQDVEIRFVRAMSTFHLPGFFNRREQSKSDFEWLAPRVSAAVSSGTLERRFGAAALFHHGVFRKESNDVSGARQAWEETLRIGSGTRPAKDAAGRLNELTGN